MSNRIEWIDSLRGFACILVMFAHLLATHPTLGMYANGCGKIGVWLFFVLAGYLLLSTAKDENITLKWCGKYYAKKLIKLYPVYLIGLLFAFFLGQLQGIGDLLLHLLLLKGTGHFWYMAVILKFYIIAPGILWLYKKMKKSLFIVISLVVLTVDLILFPPNKYVENSINVVWYIVVFIYGMILYVIQQYLKIKKKSILWDIGGITLGIGILFLTPWVRERVWNISPSSFLQNKYWLIGIIWCAIFLCIDKSKFIKDYLNKSYVLRFLGKISYPVYILHYVLLQWLRTLEMPWKIMAVVFIMVSIMTGWGLYEANEKLNSAVWLKGTKEVG